MEFRHNDRDYRLYRGEGSHQWMLLKQSEHSPTGWALFGTLPAVVDEGDAIDYAKTYLNDKD